MGEAQKRFNDATNQVDWAYWQGALDGEAAECERIIGILDNIAYGEGISRYGDDLTFAVALIKGEN